MALREGEGFLSRIAMVEVHLVAFQAPAAIRARNVPELSEELRRSGLATGHALDLALAVGGVLPHVRGALAGPRLHGPL